MRAKKTKIHNKRSGRWNGNQHGPKDVAMKCMARARRVKPQVYTGLPVCLQTRDSKFVRTNTPDSVPRSFSVARAVLMQSDDATDKRDLAFRDSYASMQRELSRPPPTPAAAPVPQLLFSAPSFIKPHSLSPQNRLQCAHMCPCRPGGLEANTVFQIRSDPGRRKRATNLGHAEKSTVSGMFPINVS